MENLKKSRSSMRGLFTKSVNKLEEYMKQERLSRKDLLIHLTNVEQKASQISALDQQINDLMMADEAIGIAEFEKEQESCMTYIEKMNECKYTVDDLLTAEERNRAHYSESVYSKSDSNRKYKLPKIEIDKFSGDIREWLTWWAQFQKIHDDTELANEDKFHYLRQSTVEKSKAREVVDSFPMTSTNYPKAISHLTNRFGNKDTLVEFYVRELLKLVLANALNSSKKVTVATLYDKLEAQLRALESLDVTRDRFSAILFPLVESCLPEELLRAWERHRIVPIPRNEELPGNTTIDRLTNIMEFLRSEVESEERITLARTGFIDQTKKSRKEENQEVFTAAGLFNKSKGRSKCIFCNGQGHFSNQCFSGKKMTLEERIKTIAMQKACNICLGSEHQSQNCPMKSKLKCNECGGPHWKLMCQKKQVNERTGSSSSNLVTVSKENGSPTTNNLFAKAECYDEIVLSTLMVQIHNGKEKIVVRAAIDSGSHKTYLLKRLIKRLNLKKIGEERLSHELFGGYVTDEIVHNKYKIFVENLDGTTCHSLDALDQDRICHSVPKLRKGPWFNELKLKGIELTDLGTGSTEIELLIGSDQAGKLLTDLYKFDENSIGYGIVALNYGIGWTLMGKISTEFVQSDATLIVQSLFVNELDVSQLWRLDVIGIEDYAETRKKEKEIAFASQHFERTLTVNEEGRYQIALPFINGAPPMASNKSIAERRLVSMTKKLSPQLKVVYQQIFDKWEVDGIIERVPDDELENQAHYLPHKAVLKPNSLTTPVRPVFDASAKEKKSLSLNDCLETGPNLLEVIISILIRFRLRLIGVLSDIEKAFLQLSIRPEDRDNVRFLWWESGSDGKIIVYRHRRVVFGLTCSSFLLAATINHILNKAPNKFLETINQLRNANYVDNCVTSLDNEAAVIKFKEEATTIFAEGKLNLRDWIWNSQSNDENKEISVLGLTWNLKDDTLACDIMKSCKIDDGPITKRKILSATHQIYDPIGFTIPLLICPKIYLQECWKLELKWDEEVPEEIAKNFRAWCKRLAEVKQIKIPRWIGYANQDSKSVTLHMFSDASKLAYAASVFLRIESEHGISLQLVQARSRIAPLKKLSTPRLELLGCLIGARLAISTNNDLGLENIETFYWTDSANALYWIKNEDQWGTYVWNRVSEIRKLTDVNPWRHVPGELNPADLPSRGCNAKQLAESSWWEGPEWLKLPKSQWPSNIVAPDDNVLDEERKRTVVCAWEIGKKKTDSSRLTRFTDNYEKMVRYIALMTRIFGNIKKSKENRVTGEITFTEWKNAEIRILVMVQTESFTGNESLLENMDLFVDEDQVLRVKTKVTLRDDEHDFRAPAILPGNHPITKAIIEFYHRKSAHAGTQTLMSILREKYWILKSRVAVKKVVNSCIVCKRFAAKPFGTKPTYLPPNRVNDASVFEVTGVDLAGHLFLRGKQKVWIVLFTCAVYRAIHMELVTSISTECFIQAMRRFVARRGRPRTMYSDPGSNFVGTNNALSKLDWNKIKAVVYPEKIEWILNPPKSPWWGGWWERLIGMVKDLLKKVLGKVCIDYEEMLTVLCDCESIINSRPLTYISEDPTDLATLTPDMFLKEKAKNGIVELDHIDAKYLNSKRSERQRIMTELRQRFRIEYLAQLPSRRGDKETRRIEIGEIVLLMDEKLKKIHWPLARVIEIYPGKENKVRVAKVKTRTGELIRPVKKLIPLEIRSDENFSTEIVSTSESAGISKEQIESDKLGKREENRKKSSENVPHKIVPKIQTRSGRIVKAVDRLGQNS